MESQDNQSPVKVNFFNRLRGAIKKNKDDSLEEFPLSVRFIIKYIAFTMHQAHKPTKDYNLILAVKDKELNLLLIFIKNLQLSMFISVFSVFVHENAH